MAAGRAADMAGGKRLEGGEKPFVRSARLCIPLGCRMENFAVQLQAYGIKKSSD